MMENAGVKAFYESLIEAMASSSIMTRTEALEKLTGIARGDEGRSVIQAIKQITEMQGWEEPKRTELTGENGGPIAITQIERVIV
jgi:phage terminase small subunit